MCPAIGGMFRCMYGFDGKRGNMRCSNPIQDAGNAAQCIRKDG